MDILCMSLQKCPLFKNKNLNDIKELFLKTDFSIKSFQLNEVIFSPLQDAEKIGIVLSGTVDIQKAFSSGKIVVIERKKPFELICETSIFSRLSYYPDTVVASKPCTILLFTKSDLITLLSADNGFMLNYLEALSNATLFYRHKIGLLSLNSIQEKIAGFFIHYKRNNLITNKENVIELPFSKKVWAEYLDVSRASLFRELKKMEEEDVISLEKNRIVIKNWPEIRSIISSK